MTLAEIVRKLVGPTQPVGETNEDSRRLANLDALTTLVDVLLGDIESAATAAGRPEASMRAIGSHAASFLRDVKGAEQEIGQEGVGNDGSYR